MAIEAKVDFMRQLEKVLADRVTVADMSVIMESVSDVLQGYEMRNIIGWDEEQDDLLDCYLSAMEVQGRSPKTIERYRYVITRMMNYVKVPTRQVTVYHLRNYIKHEKERGIKDSTQEGVRQIFSAYFNWLQRESLIGKNPTANLGAIKREKKVKKVYSETDMEKLTNGCKSIRDRAIIEFLASTGCRISEMTGLNWEDVNIQSLECVVHGKGNKERRVFMSERAVLYLSMYREERKDDDPALFIGLQKERLQPGGVRAMMRELQKRTGVDHVHPHKFRRTLATRLERRGVKIERISAILGHEKMDTTMGYITIEADDVRCDYRRLA